MRKYEDDIEFFEITNIIVFLSVFLSSRLSFDRCEHSVCLSVCPFTAASAV